MKRISVILLTQDADNAEILAERLEALGYQVAEMVYSMEQVRQSLRRYMPDVLVWDLNMEPRFPNSLAADTIRQKYDIPLVFWTSSAARQHLDYLSNRAEPCFTPPYRDRDLQAAVEMALYQQAQKVSILSNALSPEGDRHDFWWREHFFVKVNQDLIKISLDDILWAEAYEQYTYLQTDKQRYLLHKSLRTVEERVGERGLVRVHRAYLVNPDKIRAIESDYVYILKHKIPLSAPYHLHLKVMA